MRRGRGSAHHPDRRPGLTTRRRGRAHRRAKVLLGCRRTASAKRTCRTRRLPERQQVKHAAGRRQPAGTVKPIRIPGPSIRSLAYRRVGPCIAQSKTALTWQDIAIANSGLNDAQERYPHLHADLTGEQPASPLPAPPKRPQVPRAAGAGHQCHCRRPPSLVFGPSPHSSAHTVLTSRRPFTAGAEIKRMSSVSDEIKSRT